MSSRVQVMYMTFLSGDERAFATAVVGLAYANPFLPQRVEWERAALGPEFIDTAPVWSARTAELDSNPNVARIGARVEALVGELRRRVASGASPPDADRRL